MVFYVVTSCMSRSKAKQGCLQFNKEMQNTFLKRCFIRPVRSRRQRCWCDQNRSVTQPLIWSSAVVFSPLIRTHYVVLRVHRRPVARAAPWIPLSPYTLFCFGVFFAITHINKALNSLQPAPCNELIRCRRCTGTAERCAVKAAGNPRRHACSSGGKRQARLWTISWSDSWSTDRCAKKANAV